ncbi:MAG TPA: multicopper oxidase domain-containing protein [Thermoanaerobaculia bacterium]|nr:multicopper oxidase domain-containing protein [Thermoanaerobaculia bacterium]
MNVENSPFHAILRRLSLMVFAAALLVQPAAAQGGSGSGKKALPTNTIKCIPTASLPDLDEIVTKDGVLSGTLYTVSEQVRMTTTAGGPCYPQWVRAYRSSEPASWNPPSSTITNPKPGPTLRARVGDIVALTFLNVIDANKFPGVDDGKCDETSSYPGTYGDTYPDCFAASVYTNVHYHGTHTSPNTTADNVFLNIRPSPRKQGSNEPEITEDTVKDSFAKFFEQCTQKLTAAGPPSMWPRRWSDLTAAVQKTLMDPVETYAPAWFVTNDKLIKQGNWPQYYVGAYPYCFQIPEYIAPPKSTTPDAAPTTSADVRTPHTHGVGSAEVDEAADPSRPLVMGQAPGTHWYHAHKHGSTTINVLNGMTGAFIIEGEYDDAINAFYGDAGGVKWTRSASAKTMVIQQLGTAPGLLIGGGGGPGPAFSVNGALQPTLEMAGGSVQMWRIANTSGRGGVYFPAPATGLQWKQLAQDGVQFNAANYGSSSNLNRPFLLASGNRADLLVKAPAYVANGNNTYPVLVYNTVDQSDRPPWKPAVAAATLLTVVVTSDGPAMQFMPNAPAFPAFLSDIPDSEVTGTKIITFASSAIPPGPPPASKQTIDNKPFDGELGVVVGLNKAEEWKILNATYPPATGNQISHPFHIHINPFQVTELFDPNAVASTTNGAGTVTVTMATPTATSSTVTGTGTSFTKDFQVGDWIWINGSGTGGGAMAPGMVLSVDSDTSLTMDAVPGNKLPVTTPSTYVAAVPQYTINPVNPRVGQCVLNPNDPRSWKPCSATVPATNRIWWDVFPIPSGRTFVDAAGKTVVQIPGYFKMRSRFVDYSGYYVIHCHILAHEDRGMMTVVQVAPLQTPYSHH